MILIADSGSTKTDWRILQQHGSIGQASCAGINPYYHDSEIIIKELADVLLPQIKGNVKQVYFYGAGCSTNANINKVTEAILSIFPEAEVEVQHDLLAAARALCGAEAGIACILGTGINSCLYDGGNITDNVASLGYIMGDEGSGFDLGKRLVSDYLRRNMPDEIVDKINKRFDLSKEEVLEHIYLKEKGSTYLASFSKFIFQNIKEPYLYKLVFDSFSEFFEKNVMKYEDYAKYKVHFTGSVAFYYSDILRRVAMDKGITVRNIIESPIAGLTLYHQKKK